MSIRVDKNPRPEGPTDPEKRAVWLEHRAAARAEGMKAREDFRREWESYKPTGRKRLLVVLVIFVLVGLVAFVVVTAVRG